MKYRIVIILPLLLSLFRLAAQPAAQSSNHEKRGDHFFASAVWTEALSAYMQEQQQRPKDMVLKYKIGRTLLQLDSIPRAVEYLKFALQDKKVPDDAYWYLARAYHLSAKFETAAAYYKLYLATLKKNDKRFGDILLLIRQCVSGEALLYKRRPEFVKNAGPTLNSNRDDYKPLLKLDEGNLIYFSSNREGSVGGKTDGQGNASPYGNINPDLYRAAISPGGQYLVQAAGARYNSNHEESLMSFDRSGKRMFVYQKRFNGQYAWFEDSLDWKDAEGRALAMPAPFNQIGLWEGDMYCAYDSIRVFSSTRDGGYGGKDLYFSVLDSLGQWTAPRNFGPAVNTIYDERSPFLSNDAKTLIFSSNRPESMGGYDFFYLRLDEQSTAWGEVYNPGFPWNSPGDELDFFVHPMGSSAYFASNRTGGLGGLDIYTMLFTTPMYEQQYNDGIPSFFRNPTKDIAPAPVVVETVKPTTPTPEVPVVTPEPAIVVEEKTMVELGPILYDEKFRARPNSFKTINNLGKLKTDQPDLNYFLLAHCTPSDGGDSPVFYTAQVAELEAKLLVDQAGLSPSKLSIFAVGNACPNSIEFNPDGSPITDAKLQNNRVDVFPYWLQNTEYLYTDANTTVSTGMPKGTCVDQFKGIRFVVQLKSGNTPINEKQTLNGAGFLAIERIPSLQTSRYLLGWTSGYQEIKKTLTAMKAKGFADAFVVVYKDGLRLNDDDLKQLSSTNSEIFDLLFDKAAGGK